MSAIYSEHASDDGFCALRAARRAQLTACAVYVTYSGENTFGAAEFVA